MSVTCKINKSETPGGTLSFFDALFGRCTAFYGHFLVDVVTSEESTRMSLSGGCSFIKAFSSNSNAVNLNVFSNHGGIFN